MRSIHFDVQGFSRTYWDLFVAAELSVGVFYLFAAILTWQLGGLPAGTLAAMRVIVWALALCFAAITAVSWRYLLAGVRGAAFVWTFILFLLLTGGCGSGTSNSRPILSALAPESVIAGSGALTVLVTGSNFVPTSSVQWNGIPRTTTFSSPTVLKVQLETSDLSFAGASAITVVNPEGEGTSTAGIFTVDNALPVLSSMTPSSVVYLTTVSVELTLNGSGFGPSAVVLWNGTSLPTTFVSATQLTAEVLPSGLESVGSVSVTVVQPAPGGGTSQPLSFDVEAQPVYSVVKIAQPANDIAWNSTNGLFYLSVPRSSSSNENSIAVLDPDGGSIVASQPLSAEPSRLALSDDNQFLYVALNDISSVQRLILPSLEPSLTYSLGSGPLYGNWFALDLQVAPGFPHTSAVSLGAAVVPAAQGGVIVFDDATPRPNSAPSLVIAYSVLFDSLQWGEDATVLYAGNNETTAFDFYTLEVTPAGATLAADYNGGVRHIGDYVGKIHFDRNNQLIYVDNGLVLDPPVGRPKGAFATAGLMVPDSSNGKAFFLTGALVGGRGISIQVFDVARFTPLTSITLQAVKGNPLQFIRWGSRGLAFCTDAGYVYLVAGAFVDGSG
jgi:hypothetical protein